MKRVKANILLLIFICANWAICCLVIWWRYQISLFIHEGSYQRNEALSVVGKMSLIVTILTAAVWLFVRHRNRSDSRTDSQWRLVWNVAWKTAIVLILYVFIVLVRRQFWTPSQGDDNAFLPLVGRINGEFLSEFLWIIFLLQVIPIMAFVSGLLYSAQSAAVRRLLTRS